MTESALSRSADAEALDRIAACLASASGSSHEEVLEDIRESVTRTGRHIVIPVLLRATSWTDQDGLGRAMIDAEDFHVHVKQDGDSGLTSALLHTEEGQGVVIDFTATGLQVTVCEARCPVADQRLSGHRSEAIADE